MGQDTTASMYRLNVQSSAILFAEPLRLFHHIQQCMLHASHSWESKQAAALKRFFEHLRLLCRNPSLRMAWLNLADLLRLWLNPSPPSLTSPMHCPHL